MSIREARVHSAGRFTFVAAHEMLIRIARSELCMSVETTFSLSYLYRLFGDNAFADRAELAAFNAFPAAISPDFWSHQYVTQTNQPWSQNLTGKPFFNVVSYGNVFGLEPNFVSPPP